MTKSFFIWTGSKRRLAPQIASLFPKSYERYFEPFCGSASLYFYAQPERAVLSDSNRELFFTYLQVKLHPQRLIGKLHELEEMFKKNPQQTYYEVRRWDRLPSFEYLDDATRAARFIFLCQTAFNSIYRLNKSGYFNTPMGKRKKFNICDRDAIMRCSEALQKATILGLDYTRAIEMTEKNDLAYVDPPYYPTSVSADFTGYTKEGFNLVDQITLASQLRLADIRGVKWLLSNSDTPWVRDEYRHYKILEFSRAGTMNSDPTKRGKVKELLIVNF